MNFNLIEIGDFSVERKRRSHGFVTGDECAHRRTIMESDGQVVRCRDCKVQVTAWWLLGEMLEAYTEAMDRLKSDREQIAKERATIIHLIAAREVERAWRNKKMAPSCPHCRRGILPTDGFGRSSVNTEFEITRRKAEGKIIS